MAEANQDHIFGASVLRTVARVPTVPKYMEVSAKLEAEPAARIDTAEGLRIKFNYLDDGSIYFYPPGTAGSATESIRGSILSGSDWVLVRRDGVIVFDGRVTLNFEGYILDATLKGLLDLARHAKEGTPNHQLFEQYVRGTLEPSELEWPLQLSVRFEGSDVPPRSQDVSWLPQRLRDAIQVAPKYNSLLRQQFLASGTVTVKKGAFYPPESVFLEVLGRP